MDVTGTATSSDTGYLINTALVSAANEPTAYQNATASATITVQAPPVLTLTKTASTTAVPAGVAVTYTYVVTNNGLMAATNVKVTDDGGIPNNPNPITVGTISSLAVGASQTFTRTFTTSAIPPGGAPINLSTVINGVTVPIGTLTTTLLTSGPYAGNYQVVLNQSLGIVNNTYGTNASAGWTSGHKFSDLLGSDQADFQFTDSKGNVVLDFLADYVSASSKFPSGYGTLGVSGGDGKVNVGSAANVLYVDTTITDNLNQSSAYYGFTTNSPATSDPLDAGWNNVDGYTVIVSAAAFGANGFGGVSIPYVHDSPSKIAGTIKFIPSSTDYLLTNTAVATATECGQSVSATAKATVDVTVGAPIPTVSVTGTDYLVSNTTSAGSLTTSTTGVSISGTTVTLTGTDTYGNPVSLTTSTNAAGQYSFTGLNPSNATGYTVTETPPATDTHLGQTSTTSGAVTTPATTPIVSHIVLTTSGATSTDNFFETATVSIKGVDFLDSNGDLIQQGGEPGLVGTTIKLTGTDAFGNAVSLTTTTTGTGGAYSFTGLNPSNGSGYTLTETPPTIYAHEGQTSTTPGAVTTPLTTPVVSNIVLTTGGATSTDIFAEEPKITPIITTTPGATSAPPAPCNDTYYPVASSNALTNVAFNENTVIAAVSPGDGTTINISDGTIKVWYTDETALALGVSQVTVVSSSGSHTTNYSVSTLGSSPGSIANPQVGRALHPADEPGDGPTGHPGPAGGDRCLRPAAVPHAVRDRHHRPGPEQRGGPCRRLAVWGHPGRTQ